MAEMAQFGNLSQSTYLEFIDAYAEADEAVADKVNERRALRQKGKTEYGIDLEAFDQMRKLEKQSGEARAATYRAVRQYMVWSGKPLPSDDDDDEKPVVKPTPADINELQIRQVQSTAFAHGRGGDSRDLNTWSPGSFLYSVWDESWREGRDALAQDQMESEAPKRRGRPKGARNKPKSNGSEA
jgi:Mg-chelatase subunit ChlI